MKKQDMEAAVVVRRKWLDLGKISEWTDSEMGFSLALRCLPWLLIDAPMSRVCNRSSTILDSVSHL